MNASFKQPLVSAAMKFPQAKDIQHATSMADKAGTYFTSREKAKATTSPGSSPPASGKKKGLLSWARILDPIGLNPFSL